MHVRAHTHTHTHTKKKTVGGREEKVKWARLGTQVSSDVWFIMPLNMRVVAQLAGWLSSQWVFAHIAGCHSVLSG